MKSVTTVIRSVLLIIFISYVYTAGKYYVSRTFDDMTLWTQIIFMSAKWTEWNWRTYCFHFVSVCMSVNTHT